MLFCLDFVWFTCRFILEIMVVKSSVSQKILTSASQIFVRCLLYCVMTAFYVAFFRDEALCKCQTCIIWKILNSHLFYYITVFLFSCWSGKILALAWWAPPQTLKKKSLGVENVRSPAAKLIWVLFFCFLTLLMFQIYDKSVIHKYFWSTKPSLSPNEKFSATFYHWSI